MLPSGTTWVTWSCVSLETRCAVRCAGWMCCVGSAWMHLSTGVVGPDRRFIVVVSSLQTANDVTARNTLTQAVSTMFPGGRIEAE